MNLFANAFTPPKSWGKKWAGAPGRNRVNGGLVPKGLRARNPNFDNDLAAEIKAHEKAESPKAATKQKGLADEDRWDRYMSRLNGKRYMDGIRGIHNCARPLGAPFGSAMPNALASPRGTYSRGIIGSLKPVRVGVLKMKDSTMALPKLLGPSMSDAELTKAMRAARGPVAKMDMHRKLFGSYLGNAARPLGGSFGAKPPSLRRIVWDATDRWAMTPQEASSLRKYLRSPQISRDFDRLPSRANAAVRELGDVAGRFRTKPTKALIREGYYGY